uniref:STAS domain-containing protein n=2 Tax=Glycine subgen. Soja TaxID=1462606 RepID=A0A0R0KMV7_SOYBN
MITLTEVTAIGRTFAYMKDYQLDDGNKEMVALETMNVVGSLTSCYVATGKLKNKLAADLYSCYQTAVSNIVLSVVVLLTLEFMTPLFKYTPNAILWVIYALNVKASLVHFVSISFAKILLQVTRPRTAILGKIPRTTVYRNIQQYPEASKIPGVLIVRVDSAIYFSNSNYVKQRTLRWFMDEEEQEKGDYRTKIQFFIPLTDIDTSGIQAFQELHSSLEKKGVELVLANPGPAVTDKLYASSFANTIGEDKIFLTVAEVVAYCSPKLVEDPCKIYMNFVVGE